MGGMELRQTGGMELRRKGGMELQRMGGIELWRKGGMGLRRKGGTELRPKAVYIIILYSPRERVEGSCNSSPLSILEGASYIVDR